MEYKSKKRVSRTIPFGWKVNEHDEWLLDPIPAELEALEQAMRYLKTSTLGSVYNWLLAKTGRKLSKPGFLKIARKMKLETARKYEAARKAREKRYTAPARASNQLADSQLSAITEAKAAKA